MESMVLQRKQCFQELERCKNKIGIIDLVNDGDRLYIDTASSQIAARPCASSNPEDQTIPPGEATRLHSNQT